MGNQHAESAVEAVQDQEQAYGEGADLCTAEAGAGIHRRVRQDPGKGVLQKPLPEAEREKAGKAQQGKGLVPSRKAEGPERRRASVLHRLPGSVFQQHRRTFLPHEQAQDENSRLVPLCRWWVQLLLDILHHRHGQEEWRQSVRGLGTAV